MFLHLGIDYGTSATKVVVRDYAGAGGERAYPIGWSLRDGSSSRLPSVVTISNGRAFFGRKDVVDRRDP